MTALVTDGRTPPSRPETSPAGAGTRCVGPIASGRRRRLAGRLRFVACVAAAGALIWRALPILAGSTWGDLVPAARDIHPDWLVALVLIWVAGLLVHTITLTAALPGLTHRRALTLSLTGSAIANVLPLGGAAGVALNYRMAKRWGHSGAAIGTYTVITNAWDVFAKFLLPVLTLPAPMVETSAVNLAVSYAVVGAALALATLTGLGLVTLSSPTAAARAGGVADRVLARWLPPGTCRESLVALQADTSQIVRTSWRRLSIGMLLYTALLFALLLGCLTAAGAGLSIGAVLAGFTVERLLTLAGLTPGGAGIVEVGLASTLLTFPGAPVGVALGVLLYRALSFGLEIPVGGIVLVGWLWVQRRTPSRHQSPTQPATRGATRHGNSGDAECPGVTA
ncbi:lysylphosphatidylglycerol synthase transmembrane domain-containing protein [Nocardioides sp. URHA0032]|uniref:lysylphosphatidylglycerol synthase transmembrane domain-containing protein n=1 Tax=Nocardioides sp. URHA0032 TaxID=1380388 RepID=UPI0018CC073B|nr:lysylphosphatidylglycerol synthase domain-containing protein [Nocardioides sp. URHA0032]